MTAPLRWIMPCEKRAANGSSTETILASNKAFMKKRE